MEKRSFKRNRSGQVLIVSALLISMLLLSTALYVLDLEKQVPEVDAREKRLFSEHKQSARNTLISALANATDGGNIEILESNLDQLKNEILSHSYHAMLILDYTTLNSNPYQNGIWISWGSNGQGISSAYTTFLFEYHSPSETSSIEYEINVTSSILMVGNYQPLNETTINVNLSVNLLNEAKAALADSFIVSYYNETNLIPVNLTNINNYGNGTYSIYFSADRPQLNNPLIVSLLCQDKRGIFVGANATCPIA